MEVEEARGQVRRLVEELLEQDRRAEEARNRAAEATGRATTLRVILRGFRDLFPELDEYLTDALDMTLITDTPGSQTPRGAEAVLRIMQDAPGEKFAVSELLAALKERGWLPDSVNPANAVRTALERLVSNNEESDVVKWRYRDGTVSYSYEPDRDHDPVPNEPPATGSYDEEPF